MSKKKGMSREDAAELYQDLKKVLAQSQGGAAMAKSKPSSSGDVAKQIAAEISKAMSSEKSSPSRPTTSKASRPAAPRPQARTTTEMPSLSFGSEDIPTARNRGAAAAVGLVMLFGVMRVALSGLEAMGLVGIENAQATLQPQAVAPARFGKEEVKVLTSLDSRRAELTERSKALDEREKQLSIRDREFAVRVAQLKELTDQLKNDREKSDKKRSAQIEQLANVYGSMSPQEAAQLMEQLDVQIALSLIERMPEKKIGQILALMSKERALTLTKMLSGKAQG